MCGRESEQRPKGANMTVLDLQDLTTEAAETALLGSTISNNC